MEIAILALGCFWDQKLNLVKLDGIIKTEVGYCGGNNSQNNLSRSLHRIKQIMLKL